MALYMRVSCSRVSTLKSLLKIFRSKQTSYPLSIYGIPSYARRTLLSDAYKGTSAWNTRRLLAVNMDELKITLDADFFDMNKPVSSVDLHKFIDNISEDHELQSAEKYLFCHRHSPMANHLRASTVHCYIRACIDLGMTDAALKVLQDKTNYGLFPDTFTFNLLLNDFLQREDIRCASAVAMEMMRLEILTNEERLSQLLSLYACHRYLKSGENSEEEVHDLGMTFADATRGQTGLLSSSYHLLGVIMTGRLKEVARLLQASLDRGGDEEKCVVQEVVERLQGELEHQTEADQELLDKIRDCVTRLEADGRISTESLDSLVTLGTLPLIKEVEQNHAHIKMYPSILETWHKEHIEAIKSQIKAAQGHERSVKEKKLDRLMEAVGGLKYWIEKEGMRKREEATDGETDEAEMEKHSA